jgi:membrane-bound lytic murein transglycosylase A
MPRSAIGIIAVLILIAGCNHNQPAPIDYSAALPPGELALRKIPPAMYPDFSIAPADLARLRPAIENSLEYLAHPSSQGFYPYGDIGHDRAVATLRALDQLAAGAASQSDPGWVNAQIRQNFEVYQSVGAPSPDGAGYTDSVLFTGYFTPIYNASLTRTGPYQYPLYKRPADLVSDPLTGDVRGRRLPDGTLTTYYTRQQIESGELAGGELVWLTSRWEAYVVTVQGSGRLRLPDGRIYEVGYAGNNGFPYTGISQQMIADGAITPGQQSLRGMRTYFAQHPEAMDRYLPLNQRTVFFAERPGGPYGSLNVPVTPFATIATDKETRDIYPRAMPAFLLTAVPSATGENLPYRGFMLDQDTGGAIRAAGRCDIYMGIGQGAEQLAGHELNEGKLYYIAVKPELMANYSPATAPDYLP